MLTSKRLRGFWESIMAEIHFSPAALRDMQDIKAYITDELCSEQAALHTVSRIMKRIRQLEAFPELGAPLASVVELDVPYRYLVCGNYLAFYRIDRGDMQIIRVLYGRRNYMQILFGQPDGKL